jgi:hypothetical protein
MSIFFMSLIINTSPVTGQRLRRAHRGGRGYHALAESTETGQRFRKERRPSVGIDPETMSSVAEDGSIGKNLLEKQTRPYSLPLSSKTVPDADKTERRIVGIYVCHDLEVLQGLPEGLGKFFEGGDP